MGGKSSKPDNTEAGAASEQAPRSGNKRTMIYAELVGNAALPADLPPIKVLINQSLATTAIDTLRDSQAVAHDLSKQIVLDFLNDKRSPEQLGTLLRYIFQYESVLKPTRHFIYWSLHLPVTYRSLYINTQLALDRRYISPADASLLAEKWVRQRWVQSELLVPLLRWTLRQPDIAIEPVEEIVAYYLPFAREVIKENARAAVREALRSNETRDLVRNSIVGYLSKDDPQSTTVE